MENRRAIQGCGFTLLEILITMILLVVGVIAVVKALSDGTSIDNTIEKRIIATQLAQEQIELQKNVTPFSSIQSISGRSSITGFSGYTYDVVVSPTGNDLKQITVDVYWTTGGTEQKVTLQTLFTNLTPGS